jgi:hypothetical protein
LRYRSDIPNPRLEHRLRNHSRLSDWQVVTGSGLIARAFSTSGLYDYVLPVRENWILSEFIYYLRRRHYLTLSGGGLKRLVLMGSVERAPLRLEPPADEGAAGGAMAGRASGPNTGGMACPDRRPVMDWSRRPIRTAPVRGRGARLHPDGSGVKRSGGCGASPVGPGGPGWVATTGVRGRGDAGAPPRPHPAARDAAPMLGGTAPVGWERAPRGLGWSGIRREERSSRPARSARRSLRTDHAPAGVAFACATWMPRAGASRACRAPAP